MVHKRERASLLGADYGLIAFRTAALPKHTRKIQNCKQSAICITLALITGLSDLHIAQSPGAARLLNLNHSTGAFAELHGYSANRTSSINKSDDVE